MIFYKPYGVIALVVVSAIILAIVGFAGLILVAALMGVMAVLEMKFDDIAKLAELENTSYRLVSFDVDDGAGGTVRKFKVEMFVAFPIGWSSWHNVNGNEGFDTEELARAYYDALLNDHKASLVRLRTRRSKGTNGRIHALATIADIQRLQAKDRISATMTIGSGAPKKPRQRRGKTASRL